MATFEKMRVSLLLAGGALLAAVSAAAGAGVTLGASSERIRAGEERLIKLEKKDDERVRDERKTAERITVVETKMDAANEALGRIESKLGTK